MKELKGFEKFPGKNFKVATVASASNIKKQSKTIEDKTVLIDAVPASSGNTNSPKEPLEYLCGKKHKWYACYYLNASYHKAIDTAQR